MGYYTDYDVTISNLDNANQGVKIVQMLDMRDYHFSDDGLNLNFSYNGKWYDWKEDCIRVSLQYPKILIELHGVGEDRDDRWKARVQNGLCEVVQAVITFPDFDLIKKTELKV